MCFWIFNPSLSEQCVTESIRNLFAKTLQNLFDPKLLNYSVYLIHLICIRCTNQFIHCSASDHTVQEGQSLTILITIGVLLNKNLNKPLSVALYSSVSMEGVQYQICQSLLFFRSILVPCFPPLPCPVHKLPFYKGGNLPW